MYDLDRLYKAGYAEELREKFLECSHQTIAVDDISADDSNNDIAERLGVDESNIGIFRRGHQLRSGGVIYSDIASFSRGRLSYVEYQALCVLKQHPGMVPRDLYNYYLMDCYSPVSFSAFSKALYRLVSLRRAKATPISAKRQTYSAYIVSLRSLECRWCMPTAYREPPRRQGFLTRNSYTNWVGCTAARTVKFTNARAGQLTKPKQFYLEFNRLCDCGGAIVIGKDGVRYCATCGLVEQETFIPGIENFARSPHHISSFDNLHTMVFADNQTNDTDKRIPTQSY